MSRFLVTLVLALAVVAVSARQVLPPNSGATYGVINRAHTSHLPNVVSGHQQLYVLTNFAAPRDETLASFAVLYTPLPAGSADTGADVLLSVARPTGSGNNVQLVASGFVHLTQSGESTFFDGVALGLQLQVGDYLVVSVPSNKVELHVGPNAGGNGLQYSIISAAITTDATAIASYTGLATAYIAGPAGDQLCGTYGTIGAVNNLDSQQQNIMFASGVKDIVTPQGVTGHIVTSFIVGIVGSSNQPAVTTGPLSGRHSQILAGQPFPDPVTVEIVIAKPGVSPLQSTSDWYLPSNPVDPTRVFTVTGVMHMTTILTDIYNIRVYGGEKVGIRVKTPFARLTWTDNRDIISNLPLVTKYYLWSPCQNVDECGQSDPLLVDYFTPGDDGIPNFQFTIDPKGDGGGRGDPQFAGFQGQNFQFHGLADEHFNLISTPSMQLNAHFVYLSSGKCNFNNTVCFQHPGTYVDVLGFSIPSVQGEIYVRAVAGSHEAGLRVWMGPSVSDMKEVHMHKHSHGVRWSMSNDTADVATLIYNVFGEFTVETPLFSVNVVNSDYFFNMGMTFKNRDLLRIGAVKHTVTDHQLCDANAVGKHSGEGHSHVYDRAVEDAVAAKYPAAKGLPQVHGLIGQTWRNVRVCSKEWMGNVQDYVVADLFSEDYVFNFYASSA